MARHLPHILLHPQRRGASSSRPGAAAAAGLLHAAQQQHEAFIALACPDEPSLALTGALSVPYVAQAAAAGSKLRLQLATTGRGRVRQLPQRQGAAQALQRQQPAAPPQGAHARLGADSGLQRLEQQLMQLHSDNARRNAELLTMRRGNQAGPAAADASASAAHTTAEHSSRNGSSSAAPMPGGGSPAASGPLPAHLMPQLQSLISTGVDMEMHFQGLCMQQQEIGGQLPPHALQLAERGFVMWVLLALSNNRPLSPLAAAHSGWRKLLLDAERYRADGPGGGANVALELRVYSWAAFPHVPQRVPEAVFTLLLRGAQLAAAGARVEELSPEACAAYNGLLAELLLQEQARPVAQDESCVQQLGQALGACRVQLLRALASPGLRPEGAPYGSPEHLRQIAQTLRAYLAPSQAQAPAAAAAARTTSSSLGSPSGSSAPDAASTDGSVGAAVAGHAGAGAGSEDICAALEAAKAPLPALRRTQLWEELARPEWADQPSGCGGSALQPAHEEERRFGGLVATLQMMQMIHGLLVCNRRWGELVCGCWPPAAQQGLDAGAAGSSSWTALRRGEAEVLRNGVFAAGLLACHGVPLAELDPGVCTDYHTLLRLIKQARPDLDIRSLSVAACGAEPEGAAERHRCLLRLLKASPPAAEPRPSPDNFENLTRLASSALLQGFGEDDRAAPAALPLAAPQPQVQVRQPLQQQQRRAGSGNSRCSSSGGGGSADGSCMSGDELADDGDCCHAAAGDDAIQLSSASDSAHEDDARQAPRPPPPLERGAAAERLQRQQQRRLPSPGGGGLAGDPGADSRLLSGASSGRAAAAAAGGPNCLLPACGAGEALPALRWLWGAVSAQGAGQATAPFVAVGGPQMALALVVLHAWQHLQRQQQDELATMGSRMASVVRRARVPCLAFQPMCSAPFAARWLPQEQRRRLEEEAAAGGGPGPGVEPQQQAVFPPPPGVDGVVALTRLGARVPADAMSDLQLQGSARCLGKARARRAPSTASICFHSRDSAGFNAAYEEAARRMVAAPRGEAAPLALQARGTEGLEAALLLAAKVRGSLALQRRDACVWLDGLTMDWDDPRDAARLKDTPVLLPARHEAEGSDASGATARPSAPSSLQLLLMQAIGSVCLILPEHAAHGAAQAVAAAASLAAASSKAGVKGDTQPKYGTVLEWVLDAALLPLLHGLPLNDWYGGLQGAASKGAAGEGSSGGAGGGGAGAACGLVFSLCIAECEPGRPARLLTAGEPAASGAASGAGGKDCGARAGARGREPGDR